MQRPSLVPDLIRAYFDTSGRGLAIGGLPVPALCEQYGTPLFVYDAAIIRNTLRQLRDATCGRFDIFYSIKANPNPAVISVLAQEGAGLEIASAGEYALAVRAGGTPERIVFAGPAKTAEELEYVVSRGIGEIHLESREEIERVAAIAADLKVNVPVAIRVNPTADAQGGAMRMGGQPTQFGFDEEDIEDIVAAVENRGELALTGLHLYAGTQTLNADTLLAQWTHAFELARRVSGLTGRPLKTLDLGGGLGIPYFANETPLDLARIREGVARLISDYRDEPNLKDTRIILEPGRFLVGPAGVYLARVQGVKTSRGSLFVVTDGGMQHHLAASGNLGQVIKRDYPQLLANKATAANCVTAAVVGPLCTPLDTIGRSVELPEPEAGDIVAVLQSGAYGLTASPAGFLSHPMPAEVLVDSGMATLIRPRGTFEEPMTRPV